MKILLITPSHLKTVPMSNFAYKALKELGHDVKLEGYNESFFEKIISKLNFILGGKEIYLGANRRIRSKIMAFKPDLLLAIYGINISKITLSLAKKHGIKRACWWLNDPFQFERGYKIAKNYDIWLSNSLKCSEIIYKNLKIPSLFLPTAFDPETHKPKPRNIKFQSDLCFAGDWSKSREQLMFYLVKKGFKIKIFGPWGKKLGKESMLNKYLIDGFFTPSQMADFFSNTKIVVNLHSWHGNFTHGVNPRLFEAAGCKAFQLVDYKDEIPNLFDIKNEIVTYKKISEIPALIDKFLKNKKLRLSYTKKAYRRAINYHTYVKRMEEMLSFILNR